MSGLESTCDDEDDTPTDFWEHRQIGRIAAQIILRNTAAAKGRMIGAAELMDRTTEQQSSMS